jgi:ribose/xylose/arabinose/galactoside ABC-type transport system permease subunit
VICALCALIGGLLLSGYLGYVDQTVGNNVGLNSITAAIIGGVAFSGGRGGPIGSAIGAVLMTVLVNVVVVAGLAEYWQYIVVGVALVLAVTIQGLRDRWLPDSA